MGNVTGGCLCGSVRYTIAAEPVAGHLCHCRDCQRYTGSAFLAAMGFPADAVAIQGELKTFSIAGDSGRVIKRSFCPNCGSAVVNGGEGAPGRVFIQIGTLDDPLIFTPARELYCDRELPWLSVTAETTRFAKMRP